SPVLSLTPNIATARRLALVWGVHAVHIDGVQDVDGMTALACDAARREGFAAAGQTIVAIAGVPFGAAGTTN
ncbi:MAG TPA: pyruvate kinase alpha/beta domain-containing protein, partial [Rhodocyclaceae bacterium]|nr:pyruvate kinase alpha/beta domain-containing protein [Rhodocyclaceae bacterium]